MSRLLVRAPNHLGDVLMALPAIRSLQPADVLVPRWLAPVLDMAGLEGETIPFDRGTKGLLSAARVLRSRRYERGVLLAPSFSAALLFVLGGVWQRRGARTDGRALLITEPVPDEAMVGLHRSATYHVLARGQIPEPLPPPALEVPRRLLDAWQTLLRQHMPGRADDDGGTARQRDGETAGQRDSESAGQGDGGAAEGRDGETAGRRDRATVVGIFPGSNASSRRWDTDRYAALAGRIAASGGIVVAFGGAGERDLTAQVARAAAAAGGPGTAFDAGGRTDLPLLAAGLAWCDLLVTNDSGPMHLAAAVGTPTVSLQGASDPRRTRPLGRGHVLLQHPELPCVPCIRNACPRSGAGTLLPEARRECLRLITVDDVDAAVRAALAAREA